MNKLQSFIILTVVLINAISNSYAQDQLLGGYELVVQIGHGRDITQFDISDDKKHCVTGSYDKTVNLWDVEKCKLIRTFIGHKGEIIGVAISKDKKYVASISASPDYDLKLWNAFTGDSIYTLRSPTGWSFDKLAITADNKYIVCSKGSKIEVLDLLSGKLVKALNGHSDDINSICCSSDGKYFITGGEDQKMILWDAVKLSKKKSFSGIKSTIYNVGFSIDGTAVFCNADKSNYVFDIETGKKIGEVGYCSTSGDISPDKRYMLTNGSMWDIASGKKLFDIQEAKNMGYQTFTAYGSDGKTIVSAFKGSLALFESESGTILKKTGGVNKSICGGAFFTPDMHEIFHGDNDGKLLFWNLQDLAISRMIKGNDKAITSIAMTNDYSKVLVAGKDGFTCLYDTKEFKYRSGHSSGASRGRYPYEVAISPDGTHFATISVEPKGDITYFRELNVKEDLAVGRSVKTYDINDQRHIAFSGDNKYLFSTDDGTSYISAFLIAGDLFSNTPYLNHKWGVYALATSADGKFLLSGSGDKTMKLWNANTYECLRTFEGQHSDDIRAVAISNSGKLAVSGSDDRSVIVWDTQTAKPIRKFTGHGGSILSVKFSPDDKYVISSSSDRSIRIWNVVSGHWTSFITSSDNQQWLVFNSDDYWDSSPNGGDFVAMVNGVDTWNIDQFAVKNNRPDLILSGLGSSNTTLIEHYKKQYLKRLRKLGINEVNLTNTSDIPTTNITSITNEGTTATVNALFTDKSSALKRYNLFVNDVPIFGALGKEITGNEKSISESIPLCAGQNKVEVSCINSNGVESYRALTYVNISTAPLRNLYLLAFGVSKYKNPSYNLRYADKDALDLEKVAQNLKGKGFENVYTKVLTNEQVTPDAIKASKDFVKNAKPDDTFILFIAGHGMHDKDAEATYYYLTSNADINNLKATSADFETIEDLLQGIPPRNKLFLMDACESGEIDDDDQGQMIATATGVGIASRGFKTTSSLSTDNRQLSTKRTYLYQKDRYIYNDLVRRSGAIVFSSSKGGELSYERSDIENGLFTEYIMKALTTTEADKDNNGIVSTDELRQYVSAQVAKASGDLQHPTVDRDNIYQKFGF